MAEKLEQRAAVKFCFLIGKMAGETVVMLETAYKEAALGRTQVFEWFSRFRNGELSLADKPRSGRPSTSWTDENTSWEFMNWSWKTVAEQLTILLICLVCPGVPANGFWARNCKWKEWWLHHDNAPAHKALSVKQFLTKNSMTQLLHLPYSPDLAPCDFFLFPRMKKVLKGKCFANVEKVKKKMTEARVSGLLRKVENTFRPVHYIKWTVLRRRFNL